VSGLELARRVRQIRANYEHAISLLEEDRRRLLGDDADVQGRQIALEAHVRKYWLDPLLEALGWGLETPVKLVVEDPVESSESSSHRRFLDYHGRDCDSGQSFLIFEAKRPSVELPVADAFHSKKRILELIPIILSSKDSAESPTGNLSHEWALRVSTLIDYSQRVVRETGSAPAAAVLTNGDWFVIFADVAKTLLSPTPDTSKVVVIPRYEEFEERCDEIYAWLSYASLSGRVPPQRPAAILDFVPEGEVAECAHIVDVWYGQHGDDQPMVSMRVAVCVSTSRNGWVPFYKQYPGGDFTLLTPEIKGLSKVLKNLIDRATDLVGELRRFRQVRIISAAEFERRKGGRDVAVNSRDFTLRRELRSETGSQYRLTLGDSPILLTVSGDFDGCAFHYWAACNAVGSAEHSVPVFASSVQPLSFFPNGSRYHCAHSEIHTRRREKCVLRGIENYLCCRRCVYFSRCWSEEEQSLPCQKAR
jgi:hypothetical protein